MDKSIDKDKNEKNVQGTNYPRPSDSDKQHDQQTVMLAPASGFYGSPGLGKNEVRLAYVLNTSDLGKAMDCLEKALEEYPGRTLDSPN